MLQHTSVSDATSLNDTKHLFPNERDFFSFNNQEWWPNFQTSFFCDSTFVTFFSTNFRKHHQSGAVAKENVDACILQVVDSLRASQHLILGKQGQLDSPACSAQVNALCCVSAMIDLLGAIALFFRRMGMMVCAPCLVLEFQ